MAGNTKPTDDPAFIELAEAYAKREMVLFVGAGVSAAAGLPSWGRLVELLAERARQRGAAPVVLDEIAQLAGRGQLIDALSALRAALGPQEFGVAIERLLDDRTHAVPDAGHAIADLAPGLRALLTTNIDRLLERALGGQWPEVARATGDLAQRERVIVKLHGTLYDRSTWVFTRDDYDRAMYADPRLAAVFSAIFHARTLLFVGYGLADDDFDRVLSKVRAVSGDQAPRHFALVPASTVAPLRKQRLEAAGLRLIPYENADGKHGEVASFLRALAGTSTAAASPPTAAAAIASAGAPATTAGATATRKQVLLVAANPRGTDPLKLDAEIRALKESIKLGKHRDAIDVEVLHATTIDDLRRALLEKPRDIVHFCGHATKDGLQLADEGGRIVEPDTAALAELMKRRRVETVLLNACYSLEAIKSSPVGTAWTVAMEGLVSDAGAIELSRGFYDVIGGGGGVEEAFAEGVSSAKLKRRAVRAVLIGQGASTPSGGGSPTTVVYEREIEALRTKVRGRRVGKAKRGKRRLTNAKTSPTNAECRKKQLGVLYRLHGALVAPDYDAAPLSTRSAGSRATNEQPQSIADFVDFVHQLLLDYLHATFNRLGVPDHRAYLAYFIGDGVAVPVATESPVVTEAIDTDANGSRISGQFVIGLSTVGGTNAEWRVGRLIATYDESGKQSNCARAFFRGAWQFLGDTRERSYQDGNYSTPDERCVYSAPIQWKTDSGTASLGVLAVSGKEARSISDRLQAHVLFLADAVGHFLTTRAARVVAAAAGAGLRDLPAEVEACKPKAPIRDADSFKMQVVSLRRAIASHFEAGFISRRTHVWRQGMLLVRSDRSIAEGLL